MRTKQKNPKRFRPKPKRYAKATAKRTAARQSVVSNKRAVVKVERTVANLSRLVKGDMAHHTRRYRDCSAASVTVNQANLTEFAAFRTTECESAMNALRYYNPAVPGTLTTADASSGTYERKIHFKSVYTKLRVRNNYQIPCRVRIYLGTPKVDTAISPVSNFTGGLADQAPGVATNTPLMYPTDVVQVTANWNLTVKKDMFLLPGREFTVAHSSKPFTYDPAVVDAHSLAYQKKYQSHIWVVRLEGCLAHSNSGQYTTDQARVDLLVDRKIVINYDAGTALDDYTVDNQSDTAMTGGGFVSGCPVSDNQQYSII